MDFPENVTLMCMCLFRFTLKKFDKTHVGYYGWVTGYKELVEPQNGSWAVVLKPIMSTQNRKEISFCLLLSGSLSSSIHPAAVLKE